VETLKIGISSLFILGRPFEELVETITHHAEECRCWEIVDEDRLKLDRGKIATLRELQGSYNLEFTVHAPFTDLNIASVNPEVRRLSLETLKRSLANAESLGAKVWVFHPGSHGPTSSFLPGEDLKLNLESIDELADYAESTQVKLGLENMPGGISAILAHVEEFEEFFKAAKPNVGLTLDVGHAHILGEVDLFLRKLGDRLVHVHVHDNDRSYDKHYEIGKGSINWDRTISLLKRNGFNGILMVESTYNPLQRLRALRELVEGGSS